ncbi:MAG TPA: hypothetical protein VHZ31_00965 [Solirubrobacteraceae bacterium]|jgi:hypothetical protein|nr:hypothetical protein [Solirubrobacteraceae bacterium]
MAAELEELAYQAALNALASQERALTELRQRAGTVLAAAPISGSFLGAQALTRHGLHVLAVLALIALAASVLLSLLVLLPRKQMVFSIDAPTLYTELFAHADDPLEVHRRLAYWLQSFHVSNESRIDALVHRFELAVVALALEIVLWASQLALG